MIMKKLAPQLVTILLVGSVSAQTLLKPLPPWIATIHVVNESGEAVVGADVEVSYYIAPPPGRSEAGESIRGLTDTNGTFTASHKDTGSIDLGFRITKPGFYPTIGRHDLFMRGQYDDKKVADNRNATPTMVLRKIGRPISMYAKREETKIQKEDEPVGFDLTAGDWISPFGNGKNTDLVFTVHRKIINDRGYDAVVTLTFPNKGDGIAVAPSEPDIGSELRTPRTAAESGYEAGREWHYGSGAGPESVFGYFIRVRTLLDENGNVRSALYGKIRGDLRFYAGTKVPRAGMGFDYYLNPTPNDRNVEFDPKQNLFKDLKPGEEINQP